MLAKDIKYLREWIKQASKRHSDKYVRGFVDSVLIANEVLDNLEELVIKVAQTTDLLAYTDDISDLADRKKRLADEERSANIRQRLISHGNPRDKDGLVIPCPFTDEESQFIIDVMLAKARDKTLKGQSKGVQKHWTKMSKEERKQTH